MTHSGDPTDRDGAGERVVKNVTVRAAAEVVEKAELALEEPGPRVATEVARGERVTFGSLRGLTLLDPGLRRTPAPSRSLDLTASLQVIDLRE